MQARILSFRSSIPTPTSLSPFKHQLPRLHPQPPFRHSTDHHNRHNSNKITLITTIKALSSKILTPTNKTYISPEEVKGSTTKTIQTTQVATSTITTTTIRDTKVITKTNLSSMPPSSSSSSNHYITIPLNKDLTQIRLGTSQLLKCKNSFHQQRFQHL